MAKERIEFDDKGTRVFDRDDRKQLDKADGTDHGTETAPKGSIEVMERICAG